MSNVLRLAIVDPDDSSRDMLKAILMDMEIIWLEAEASRYEFFADVVGQTKPDVGLVVIDSDPEKALELVSRMGDESPDCSVLVVSSSNDGDLILRAMRAGAKEFLTKPVRIQDFMASFGRISERGSGRGEGKSRPSQIIAVAGANGGVGTTSIAVNLACALAQDEHNTAALVDLDLSLGDADVFLDTIPDYTLMDVAQNVTRLDFSLLKRSLTKHSSGLFLLPRPVQLEDVSAISAEDLQRVLGLLKATFTHVVLDLSKSYSAIDLVALEMADHILLVTQLDLPCLRNVVRLMGSFNEMEEMAEKVKVVVNRMGFEQSHITIKKAKDTIGHDIYWQLPNDYRTMGATRNDGVPLVEEAPKAAVTQSIASLAKALASGEKVECSDIQNSRFGLGRLLGLGSGKGGK
jgi:pilus assembly protein CpaE